MDNYEIGGGWNFIEEALAMRIGVDCRLWDESGVGRYIRNLVRELQIIDSVNDYTLFVLSKDYENVKCRMSNVKWRIVEADIKWHSIEEQLRMPIILKKENLDLVHFPYISVPMLYNRPYVVTIHDLIQSHYASGKASTLPFLFYYLKRIGYKNVLKTAIHKAKKILVPLKVVRNDLITTLNVNPEKIVVTTEGFDSNIQEGKISNGLNQVTKQPYFLYVGNAYPHKNLEKLIEGFRLVKSKVKLILVGRDDYFYKRLKKDNKDLIFLHNISDQELYYLYSNAVANVSASLIEGFGLPAIEAMASGCLVLLSNIPAFREVCGDAAIYFNPHDVKDIALKMKDVYLNRKKYLKEKIEKGSERVKLFSWKKMAKQTLEVYESCVSL